MTSTSLPADEMQGLLTILGDPIGRSELERRRIWGFVAAARDQMTASAAQFLEAVATAPPTVDLVEALCVKRDGDWRTIASECSFILAFMETWRDGGSESPAMKNPPDAIDLFHASLEDLMEDIGLFRAIADERVNSVALLATLTVARQWVTQVGNDEAWTELKAAARHGAAEAEAVESSPSEQLCLQWKQGTVRVELSETSNAVVVSSDNKQLLELANALAWCGMVFPLTSHKGGVKVVGGLDADKAFLILQVAGDRETLPLHSIPCLIAQ